MSASVSKSRDVPKVTERGQCSELIDAIAKAMTLVAPKLTGHDRQYWSGMPSGNFAQVLEQQVFLPTKAVTQQQCCSAPEEVCRELLTIAVKEGLVVMAEGIKQPAALSNNAVVPMAKYIHTLLNSTHIIDCNADPFIPDGWSILPDDEQLANRVRGTFKWDRELQKNALYLDKGQKNGRWMKGDMLRRALDTQLVLPATVLDYLLINQHLIPETLRSQVTFFWGTIYGCKRNSRLYVRCLFGSGVRWQWSFRWLGYIWGNSNPAAVAAS